MKCILFLSFPSYINHKLIALVTKIKRNSDIINTLLKTSKKSFINVLTNIIKFIIGQRVFYLTFHKLNKTVYSGKCFFSEQFYSNQYIFRNNIIILYFISAIFNNVCNSIPFFQHWTHTQWCVPLTESKKQLIIEVVIFFR